MPKFGSHIIFADLAYQKKNELFPDLHRPAFNFGAVGPDTTLFLFDFAEGDSSIRKGMNAALEVLDTIRRVREEVSRISSKLGEPFDDISNWLTGGLSVDLKYTVNASIEAVWLAAKLGVTQGAGRINIKNPLFGQFPNMPSDFIKNPEFGSQDWTIDVVDNYGFPFRYFGHPYTIDGTWKEGAPVGDYSKWWWMDLLHYRKTGEFGKVLLSEATGSLELSYARGYVTHIAGDVCGHPFINALVQGPFRNHAYRHLVLETLADTWLWNQVGRGDIIESRLDKFIHLGDSDAKQIADLIVRTMRKIYRGNMVPQLLDNGYPTPDEFLFAYRFMQNYLRLATDGGIEMPTPPADTPREIIEELKKLLQKNKPGKFPKYNKDPLKFLEALFSWFAKGISLLTMIATLPYAVLARIVMAAPRWAIYLINLGLFYIVSAIRTILCLTGWGYCSRSDFASFAFLGDWIKTTSPEGHRYPVESLPIPKDPFYWLVPPIEHPRKSVERETTVAFCNTSGGIGPDWMIDPANRMDPAAITAFAEAGSTSDTRRLQGTFVNAPSFGNAVDFSIALLEGSVPMYDFDLDGDRGYGYRPWEGYPPNDEYL